jgi:hypothetical protein
MVRAKASKLKSFNINIDPFPFEGFLKWRPDRDFSSLNI